MLRPAFWKPVWIILIAMQLGIFATSQLVLWMSWQNDTTSYWSAYQPFLTWAGKQIPEDAPVAWVTQAGEGDLGDYFTLSSGLYPRSVWWIRPGPCVRARFWCIASSLDPAELTPLLRSYHVRYLIVSNVPDVILPDSERLTFDPYWSVIKLGMRQE